ncbi:MAG: M61 family metallopeptidase [Terriglobales bacterium]
MKRSAWLPTFLVLVSALCAAQEVQHGVGTPPPYWVGVRYEVSLARSADHLLHVKMYTSPHPDLRVQLPVWNALYQVRDFAQYVTSVKARTSAGAPVEVRAVDKTTWSVPRADVVEYDVTANQQGPFGSEVTEQHAFLNLAEILMYVIGHPKQQRQVLVFSDIPAGWRVATAIGSPGFAGPSSWMAESYDELVDSPVELGAFAESDFEDGDTKFRLVVDADSADYDMKFLTEMAHKLAATEIEWMQDRPIDHYVFIYHFPRRPAGGGMEHAYSTAIDASAERVRNNPGSLAGVTAHEFFHLWNVKRIRPQSLEPVDYTKEQYTRALWFSEGVTSTVADYMRVRAGMLDERGFLNEVAEAIGALEARPASRTQSVEESSLDAWLEKYQFYNLPERSISYYNKGEIVSMLLDLRMREVTAGKKSLRDLFHWMNDHYAKQGKFFPDSAGVQQAAEAVAGASFADFFERYVAGIDSIPYDEFFITVGLKLSKRTVTVADSGFQAMWSFGQAPVVISVASGSSAEKAGLRAGDIIQEVNGHAVTRSGDTLASGLRPGDIMKLKVQSASGKRSMSFTVASRQTEEYLLAGREDATAAQKARRAAWIRGDSE